MIPVLNPSWEFLLKIIEAEKPIVATAKRINWVGFTALYVLIGFKNKDIPKIKPILATFEPMIFPMTSPPAFELIAAIEVKSSGAEVATETIVNPTITGGIPSFSAKIEQ